MWLTHSWEQTFPEKDFILTRSGEPLPLHADPERIRQLLDKLVENGVDFSEKGTPIQIHLAKDREMVEIRVINQGRDLAPELQTQIFNTMVSIRPHSGGKPHLGLGLYIVRSIVEHYKGTVTASSLADPEHGAMFTIRLPIAIPAERQGPQVTH